MREPTFREFLFDIAGIIFLVATFMYILSYLLPKSL